MRQRPRARRGEGRNPLVIQNGVAVREFRELKRWSGTSLAAAIGISHSTLSNIENQKRSASLEVLERIAATLQIPVEAILREQVDAKTNRAVVDSQSPAEAVA